MGRDTRSPRLRSTEAIWRIGHAIDDADLRQNGGDDAAAKICVMFELPIDHVLLIERQALRLARAAVDKPGGRALAHAVDLEPTP